LSYWLITSVQGLSSDGPSDQKFRKWFVFDQKYAGTVKTWEIV